MGDANGHVRALHFRNLTGSTIGENGDHMVFGGGEIVDAIVEASEAGATVTVRQSASGKTLYTTPIDSGTVFRMLPRRFMIQKGNGEHAYCISCPTDIDANRLAITFLTASKTSEDGVSWFDRKTEKSSSDLYFHYYGTLQHQQNMLQDCVRTGTYYMTFINNAPDFQGKTIMDVGAGSGVLSLFAAQAGARKVYAVEASPMAGYAQRLASANPVPGCSIEVLEKKVEELKLKEKVDVLISEPIGTLLVNERMLETYIFARDHFLKPGGRMFPTLGRIHMALFTDDTLYQEILSKATFFLQQNFYGVNLTSLHPDALNQYFAQVVVDAFDPSFLVTNTNVHVIDFTKIAEEELYDLHIPLCFDIGRPCVVHGLACWFDIFFDGSVKGDWLTTAPGSATTHWFQLRCVLPQPMYSVSGSRIVGHLRLKAHTKQSYGLELHLEMPPPVESAPGQQLNFTYDLKEPYYRQLMNYWQTHVPSAQMPHTAEMAYNERQDY